MGWDGVGWANLCFAQNRPSYGSYWGQEQGALPLAAARLTPGYLSQNESRRGARSF